MPVEPARPSRVDHGPRDQRKLRFVLPKVLLAQARQNRAAAQQADHEPHFGVGIQIEAEQRTSRHYTAGGQSRSGAEPPQVSEFAADERT